MGVKRKSNDAVIQELMKLGPKKAILIIILAGLLWFINGDTFTQTGRDYTDYDAGNSDIVAGIVARVVDGDTAVVKVGGQERRVRLLGVDTPETVHPNKPVQFYGKEASNFTKKNLNGKRVWLEYDANPQDRYNRHLAYVWLNKPVRIDETSIRENMFNARLLLGGYAKVMIIKPNKRYEKLFRKFEGEAKQAKAGLWSGQ